MSDLIDPAPFFNLRGKILVSEYSFSDGCNKTRVLPKQIVDFPTFSCYEAITCEPAPLLYRNWSSGFISYTTTGANQMCMDHQFGVRISMVNGADPSQVIDNLNEFCQRWLSSGEWGSQFSTSFIGKQCIP